jgi:hypothetical protein
MPGTSPTPGEVVELEILTTVPTQVGQNILHFFTQTRTGGGCTLQELANAYDARVQSPYKGVMSSTAVYRGVGAVNTQTPRSRQYFSIANAGFGSLAAALMPTQVRGLFSWYADAAGRQNRGRTYIPFMAQASADASGNPTVPWLVLMNVLRNAIADPITVVGAGGSTTFQFCIAHRPPILIGPSIVVFATTRPLFATQRRSGGYGRQNIPHF